MASGDHAGIRPAGPSAGRLPVDVRHIGGLPPEGPPRRTAAPSALTSPSDPAWCHCGRPGRSTRRAQRPGETTLRVPSSSSWRASWHVGLGDQGAGAPKGLGGPSAYADGPPRIPLGCPTAGRRQTTEATAEAGWVWGVEWIVHLFGAQLSPSFSASSWSASGLPSPTLANFAPNHRVPVASSVAEDRLCGRNVGPTRRPLEELVRALSVCSCGVVWSSVR